MSDQKAVIAACIKKGETLAPRGDRPPLPADWREQVPALLAWIAENATPAATVKGDDNPLWTLTYDGKRVPKITMVEQSDLDEKLGGRDPSAAVTDMAHGGSIELGPTTTLEVLVHELVHVLQTWAIPLNRRRALNEASGLIHNMGGCFDPLEAQAYHTQAKWCEVNGYAEVGQWWDAFGDLADGKYPGSGYQV